MDKLIEKLIGILSSLGLDESVVQQVVAELTAPEEQSKPTVEEDTPSGDPTVTPTEEEIPPLPTEPQVEETPSEVPSADLPVDESQVAEEGNPVVPPEAEGQAPIVPPAPAFDPSELINHVNELQGQLDETLKANEGLIARVQALEEALKSAGVIDGSNPNIEVGDPLPSAAPQNPTEDVFGNVLREINGNKRF